MRASVRLTSNSKCWPDAGRERVITQEVGRGVGLTDNGFEVVGGSVHDVHDRMVSGLEHPIKPDCATSLLALLWEKGNGSLRAGLGPVVRGDGSMSRVWALVTEVDRLCYWFPVLGVDFVKIIHELDDLRLFVGGAPGSHDSAVWDYVKGVMCGSGFGLVGSKGKGKVPN